MGYSGNAVSSLDPQWARLLDELFDRLTVTPPRAREAREARLGARIVVAFFVPDPSPAECITSSMDFVWPARADGPDLTRS